MEPVKWPLEDAQAPRPVHARWVICGVLTLETAVHLKGESRAIVDMPVLRHPIEGRPLLPGTTLGGCLRSALADRLAGYRTEPDEANKKRIALLFGAERRDPYGSQSPLVIYDALGELPEGLAVEIRDGVAIDPETGVAEAHKKFDFEVLPAGTRFPVRVDMILPAPGGGDERELLSLLAAALDAFSDGEAHLGARRSRGLGKTRAVWSARRFDLTSEQGWIEWLLTDHEDPLREEAECTTALEAIRAACPHELLPLDPPHDRRNRIRIKFSVSPVHDILIRSPSSEPEGPDVSHLRSAGKPVLPGTSVAGALRARALRIARLVREDKQDGDLWVERLLGPRMRDREESRQMQPAASRLRIAEVFIENSRPRTQTRIALDRFTQAVAEGALFQERTEEGGSAAVTMELLNPEHGELGLVLLLLKDVLHGRLPFGGSSSVGRGWMRGVVRVVFPDGRSVVLEPGQAPQGDAAEEIEKAIRAFHEAPALKRTQDGRIRHV
ncbi:MAG: RAMP superfamily CRISPR-associated protein [Bryobacteraceae bacterium]